MNSLSKKENKNGDQTYTSSNQLQSGQIISKKSQKNYEAGC